MQHLRGILGLKAPSFLLSAALVCVGSLSFSTPSYAQRDVVKEASMEDKQLEPADIVFQAYSKLRDAEKAEKVGNYKEAWKAYSAVLKYYQSLKLTHPLWKPEVVKFRLDKTTETLKDLKPKVQEQLKKEQALAEGIVSDKERLDLEKAGYNVPPELLNITKKLELLTNDLQKNRARYERERTIQEAHLMAARGQLKLWQKKTQSNPEMMEKLEKEIANAEAILRNNRHYEQVDRQKLENHIKKLRADLSKYSSAPLREDLKRYKSELGKRNEELKIVSKALLRSKQEAETYKKRLEGMSLELAETKSQKARLEADLKQQAKTSTDVVKALYQKLEASKGREQKLAKELRETRVALAEVSDKFDQQQRVNKELRVQLDTVSQEKERLSALILDSPDERLKKIARQNIKLMEELRDSRDTLARVIKDQGNDSDRTVKAERDLAVAKKRILDYQEQNRKDTKRLKSLQQKLAEIKDEVNQNWNSPNLSPVEREEVAILRATAKKYQAREAFIRKKFELLKRHIIQKNEDPEAVALAQNALTAEQLKVTEKEKSIMNKLTPAGVIVERAERVDNDVAKRNLQRSKQEVEAIHRVVEGLIQRERLNAAKDLLDEANNILPNDFATLMNLGTVYMKMQDLDSAEQHFQDGIVMKRNNPFVHYMLGLCQYRKGDRDRAEKSLLLSVELDSTQEKAYYHLGAIAGDSGRFEKAEDYFKKAIRINPELAEAYMALSILFMLKEEIEQAQDYYQEALEKGMEPSREHAKMLGLPH